MQNFKINTLIHYLLVKLYKNPFTRKLGTVGHLCHLMTMCLKKMIKGKKVIKLNFQNT